MKIPADVFAELRAAIEPHDTEERRERYVLGDFPRADKVKDVDKRYRWDLYWEHARHVDLSGVNPLFDRHIDSALRRIVRPLCPATPGGLWCDCPADAPFCNYERAAEADSVITRREIEAHGRAMLERIERPR